MPILCKDSQLGQIPALFVCFYYLCTSPAWPRYGLGLTCSRLGLVFGHQQLFHDSAVRLPAGLDTDLLQGPQPPFGSYRKELVQVRCLSKRHLMSSLPFSLQGGLIQRLPPMESGIIQSEITDKWHGPCPHKSLIIVTNVWSTAVTGPAVCEAVAVWPCPRAARTHCCPPSWAFSCSLAGTQDQLWWKQPQWQQSFPAARFVSIDYRPQWKPTAEIAEFAAGFAASAQCCDFSSVRSEGRLGHLSQCLHILDSHQIVLWYTQASSCAVTYPSRMEGSGELLIPRFLWSKGDICKGLMPSLQAALGCSGGEAALPLPQASSAFSPQRSVTVSDSSAFCSFMASFLMPPQPLLPAPWYSYGCSLLLQGTLERKQNTGHTMNKIPPWAKPVVVGSPGLQESMRSLWPTQWRRCCLGFAFWPKSPNFYTCALGM